MKKLINIPNCHDNIPASVNNDPNLSSEAVLILRRMLGLMNVSLNKGNKFYDFKHQCHFVFTPTKDLVNRRVDFTHYKVEKALNELEDNGYIERIETFRYNKIRLPKFEKYYMTKSPVRHPAVDNRTPERTITKRPYSTKSKSTKSHTCNTRNTRTGITKLDKDTDKNLRLRQKLVNKALDTMAKTTNEHTNNSIPKLVNTIKRYSFNSYKSYYHYFSLFFRAKKSILNKLRKKPGLTVYDFKQYKNGLTFELNPLFNTKEASHKVYKIIWHAGKLYDKSKDHKGRDRYIMHSFQNLIGTYAYNYVLDQNAEKGPEIPIIDDKIAG